MRIIIRAVPDRTEYISYLKEHLPSAEWCYDPNYYDISLNGKQKSMLTFLKSLEMANGDAHINMEEDVLVTSNFLEKAQSVITSKPNVIIQFFSMRPTDLIEGSRWDNSFCMNQCFYLPKGYSDLLLQYAAMWHRRGEHPGGYDYMMRDLMSLRKERYWIHIPSLVEHRIAPSIADSRRSSRRQSKTFIP